MSNWPSVTSKTLIKILIRHGFILDRTKGSHQVFYNQQTGKRVVVPVHTRDLPKGTMLTILKEAGLTKDDLKNL